MSGPTQVTVAIGITPRSQLFYAADRRELHRWASRKGRIMKKLGIAGIVGGGLVAAIIGLAAPAAADYSHHDWVYDIQPHATAPHVDTAVHQSH